MRMQASLDVTRIGNEMKSSLMHDDWENLRIGSLKFLRRTINIFYTYLCYNIFSLNLLTFANENNLKNLVQSFKM